MLAVLVIGAVLSCYRAWAYWVSGLDLSVDEAQYWYWAQHPAWGYFSKPPLLAWLITASTAVCGDGALCVKAPALVLYPVTAAGVCLIAMELYGRRVGIAAATAFLLLPGISLSAMIVSTDVPLLLCWTWAMLTLLLAERTGRWRWWIACAVIVGFGLLAKYTMLFFLLGAGGWMGRRLISARPWVAASIAVAIFGPHLLWNSEARYATVQHTLHIAHWSTLGTRLDLGELGEFVVAQIGILGPMLALIVGALILIGRPPDPAHGSRSGATRLVAWFSLPLLGAMALQALFARANGNWAAPAIVALTIWLVGEACTRGWQRSLRAGVLLNAAVMLVAYHYHALAAAFDVELTRRTDPYLRVEGWREAAAAVTRLRGQYPGVRLLADERDVLAQMAYLLRPDGLSIGTLGSAEVPRHHYDLVAAVDPASVTEALYLAHRDDAEPRLDALFCEVRELPQISVRRTADASLRLHVYWLSADCRP